MMTPGEHTGQQALPGLPAPRQRRVRSSGSTALATQLPVARLALDVPVPHLDHPFDYAVPAALADDAQVGTRVRVRLGSKDVDGIVMERRESTEHEGALAPLRRVVSTLPVAPPATLRLARAVADHCAGTLADVLRGAVPPRHARAEKAELQCGAPAEHAGSRDDLASPAVPDAEDEPDAESGPGDADGRLTTQSGQTDPWSGYAGGAAFLSRLAAGQMPRAAVCLLPGSPERIPAWAQAVAAAAQACRASGRGVVIVAPDTRDVDLLLAALAENGLTESGSQGEVVRLESSLGPEARWRAFVAVLNGRARVVVGTRGAAFAPVQDPGLLVCWDDGDPSHVEERSPHVHTRDVLRIRAEQQGTAVLFAGVSRTVEVQALVTSGWLRELTAPRATVRASTPRVVALTSNETAADGPAGRARLPRRAWQAVQGALRRGPVLIGVPRAGYLPRVACARCFTRAACRVCAGPLRISGHGRSPQCAWCGALATRWRCPECGGTGLRSVHVGRERTAEELGRAFPTVPVQVSGLGAAGGVRSWVGSAPQLVVATPGAEPRAPEGYAAAALLDAPAWTATDRLDAETQTLRRWLTAAALVRPAHDGGVVLLVGDGLPRATSALVRWNAGGHADRELSERAELSLPPAVRMATLSGDALAVAAFLGDIELPASGVVLGPVPVADRRGAAPDHAPPDTLSPPVRAVLRTSAADGADLARAVQSATRRASAARRRDLVRVELDPGTL